MLLAGVMFLLMLGRRQFASSHEARVGQVAREMAESGWPWSAATVDVDPVHLVRRGGVLRLAADPDAPAMHVNPWIVPILSGQVRLQKPPLPYWCAAVAYRIFGKSEAATRLVPALMGAVASFLLYDLVLVLYGRRVALVAVLVWLTTFLVPEQYRLAMADPYLAFFTLAGVWAWVRAAAWGGDAATRGRGDAGKEEESVNAPVFASVSASPRPRIPASSFLLLFYLSLALGVLAKGPLIFLHVVLPLLFFHACFRRRLPRGWAAHALGVALFLVVAVPWPAAVLRQVPHALDVWRYESVGEVSGENQENLRAWWYYLANLPLMALPWVPLWLFSLAYPFVRNRSRLFFPVLWYASTVLVFSIVGQKKLPYLLPMMPAQAMMIALAAVPLLRIARRVRMRGLPGAIVAVQVVIGIGWAAALPVLLWQESEGRVVGLVVSCLVVLVALVPAREMLAGRPARWLVAQSVSYAAVLLAFCNLYLTPVNNARSPLRICEQLSRMADGSHRALLNSRMPEEVAFYLPLHSQQAAAPASYLVVVDDHLDADHRARSNRPGPPSKFHEFEGWVPDARLVGVRRVEMPGASGDSRWKVYELTVRRTGFALK